MLIKTSRPALILGLVGLSAMFAFAAPAYQYGTAPSPVATPPRVSQSGQASALIDNPAAGKAFAIGIYTQLSAPEKQAWDKAIAQTLETHTSFLKQNGNSGEALARRAQELTQEIASQRQFAISRATTIEAIRARPPGRTGDKARLQIAEQQLAKLILIKQTLEDQLRQVQNLKPVTPPTKSPVPVAQAAAPPTQACGPAGVGQKAPAGAPVDDIDGIRIGMTAAQVKAILACLYPDKKIVESASTNQTYLEILPTHAINGARENISVLLAGRLGNERVFKIRKDVRVTPPAPMAQVVAGLTARYGSFSALPASYGSSPSSVGMIARGVDPKFLTPAIPSFPAWPERCWANAISDNSPSGADVGCGLTVVYSTGIQQGLVFGYKLVVTDLRAGVKALAEAQESKRSNDQAARPVQTAPMSSPKAPAQTVSPARARAYAEAVDAWKACLYSRLRSQFECPDELRCIALDPEHKKAPICRADGGYIRH